jgi:hypothetical protein
MRGSCVEPSFPVASVGVSSLPVLSLCVLSATGLGLGESNSEHCAAGTDRHGINLRLGHGGRGGEEEGWECSSCVLCLCGGTERRVTFRWACLAVAAAAVRLVLDWLTGGDCMAADAQSFSGGPTESTHSTAHKGKHAQARTDKVMESRRKWRPRCACALAVARPLCHLALRSVVRACVCVVAWDYDGVGLRKLPISHPSALFAC